MSEISILRAGDGKATSRVRSGPAREKQTKASGPVFRCAGCGRAVRGTAGYIEVNTAAAGARVRYLDAHRWPQSDRIEPVNIGDVLGDYVAAPPIAPWVAWHRRCDPNIGGSTYWIGAERIATWPQLVDWTAHLSPKRWLRGTDWFDFTRDLAKDGGR